MKYSFSNCNHYCDRVFILQKKLPYQSLLKYLLQFLLQCLLQYLLQHWLLDFEVQWDIISIKLLFLAKNGVVYNSMLSQFNVQNRALIRDIHKYKNYKKSVIDVPRFMQNVIGVT